ncbi:MAG: hypothetical protein VX684_03155, partial [Planctomycetota bacterium]|nr:hypothetical protein [Planctomycetota bacterium]
PRRRETERSSGSGYLLAIAGPPASNDAGHGLLERVRESVNCGIRQEDETPQASSLPRTARLRARGRNERRDDHDAASGARARGPLGDPHP